MSKSSTGAGSGMDRKVKNRQELLRRCMHQIMALDDEFAALQKQVGAVTA